MRPVSPLARRTTGALESRPRALMHARARPSSAARVVSACPSTAIKEGHMTIGLQMPP
jgi:hypothetical protein